MIREVLIIADMAAIPVFILILVFIVYRLDASSDPDRIVASRDPRARPLPHSRKRGRFLASAPPLSTSQSGRLRRRRRARVR